MITVLGITLFEGLIGLMVAFVGVVPSWLAYRVSQRVAAVPDKAGVEGGWDALVDRLLAANEEGHKQIEALEAKIDRRNDDIDRLEAEIRALKNEVRELRTLVSS